MLERQERRSETISCQSKYKSGKMKSLQAGVSRLQTLSINWSRGSPSTDLDSMDRLKSRSMSGLKTSIGMIYWIGRWCHPSYPLMKTTSMPSIPIATGRTIMKSRCARIHFSWEETVSKPSSTDTITTITSQQLMPRTLLQGWLKSMSQVVLAATFWVRIHRILRPNKKMDP